MDDKNIVKVLKALADASRFKMVQEISDAGELSCTDVCGRFAVSQPTISHHLKLLREAGLVESERRGTWAYYRLVPEAIAELASALQA